MMKNGKIEVSVGDQIRINGRPMMIERVQEDNVIIRDIRRQLVITYGLEAFKRTLRGIGYEFSTCAAGMSSGKS